MYDLILFCGYFTLYLLVHVKPPR